ncbi:3,4-dihydroxy-2-butanone-4-phosphate synthase [Corallococcus sp. H22C18031201]|uniref:3,4-dihydroxy-2-butanone-4-phosphate synthase n=1 Tax=Citreicoccus inhibens TaxID=2849499 RepID=UPI000E766049|nr:3,4-dihydroxy-2-butanone-4-phosphate synthase [Citreicoccus inhibens]MBU8897459.1 3,4-dihydroxy-2-butanone-4-phosphate synthase [Citreicoccus inhibens]RJS16767.1 3,4-dihydroxy-2-butanone-4-phosphate synthase [Corallococcus sp. H22C18031201]
MSHDTELSTIEDAIRDIRNGKFVVVADDEDRENEGDLIMAAEKVTPEHIAFMVRHTSGIICMPMLAERLDALRLPQMVAENTESHRTAFTVSVDYRHGTTTGVSAVDRAATIRALVNPASQADDFLRPGHIFPLRYREGGVLRRAGHTEATVDLSRLAGFEPSGILCELVKDDGTMQRMPDLKAFAREHRLSVITIADLIEYRRRKDKLVRREPGQHTVTTRHGEFTALTYSWMPDGVKSLVLVKGDPSRQPHPLVRLHAACALGDVFGSPTCQCHQLLDESLATIAREGTGVLVYLPGMHGDDFGIHHKRNTDGSSPHSGRGPHESRDLGMGCQILTDLGVRSMRLMSNTDMTYRGLAGFGLTIDSRVPLKVR